MATPVCYLPGLQQLKRHGRLDGTKEVVDVLALAAMAKVGLIDSRDSKMLVIKWDSQFSTRQAEMVL
jgi:hypothetical protein